MTSNWNASLVLAQDGKTCDGCVVTSNWNASWCSAQGGKTSDGCVVTSMQVGSSRQDGCDFKFRVLKTYDGCVCDFKLERQLVARSGWQTYGALRLQGGKTSDGCVVTSNWNASWCSVQGGKTSDGCVVTSNWNASWCRLRVARLMTDAL